MFSEGYNDTAIFTDVKKIRLYLQNVISNFEFIFAAQVLYNFLKKKEEVDLDFDSEEVNDLVPSVGHLFTSNCN